MKAKVFLIGALAALVVLTVALERSTSPVEREETSPPRQPKAESPKAGLKPGRIAAVTTNRGAFKFVLYEADMPVTCKNFVELANKGFYNGLKFHRVEDWVVQGGDPKGNGTGGSGKNIKLEVVGGLGFEDSYEVGMARTNDPNSASSQFFINKKAVPQLGGQYACFGRVFEGQDVVRKTKIGDVMKQVTISQASGQDLAKISRSQPKAASPPAKNEGH